MLVRECHSGRMWETSKTEKASNVKSGDDDEMLMKN